HKFTGESKKIQNNMTSYYLETNSDFEFWAPVYSSYNNPAGDTEVLTDFVPNKNDSVIGYVHIRMWKDELKTEQQELMYKSIALGVIFLIIGLLAAYLVVRTITMPIKKLTDTVKNYSATGRIEVTHFHLRDEIFELAQAFNEMGELVQARTAELKTTVSTLQDEITLRIKSEEAVMELNRTLDERVNTEINKQREQEKLLIYQSRLSSMGETLSSIAHQWRQPLNNLRALSLDLQDSYEYGELNKDYLSNNIQQSNEQLTYMSRTIDDFRDFFKPDKDREQCNIIEVTEEALSIVSLQLKHNAISCNFNREVRGIATDGSPTYSDSGLFADLYRNEFKHVIIILINNAQDSIKEKNKNGLETPCHGIIDIDFARADGKAIVRVSDNGKGIPDDIRHRIFEPYFTTKFRSQGTGIGLYMAKVIIENNIDGRIYAENTQTGASFTIELQCAGTETIA
ncbi:MAG: HAMP domain-containing protein, partial [Nitrospirae bacterium]|nr:HAMP domain-containing protein [Nitrospirota bacterium]